MIRSHGLCSALCAIGAATLLHTAAAQQALLPDAPSATLAATLSGTDNMPVGISSSLDGGTFTETNGAGMPLLQQAQSGAQAGTAQSPAAQAAASDQRGNSNGSQLPAQQTRIFGVLANYTTVSAGQKAAPAGWKTDFKVANRQALDYTAIGFSLVTSTIAYGQNSHPIFETYNGGNFPWWAYTWRGFVDKTDQVYQGTFLFPALLHEDTRYFAMGTGSKTRRTLHAISAVVVAHSYSGRPIPNVAGIAGKIGTQAVSRTYYPPSAADFGTLTEKFFYACLRQAGFTVLREFSPDLREHLFHKKGPSSSNSGLVP